MLIREGLAVVLRSSRPLMPTVSEHPGMEGHEKGSANERRAFIIGSAPVVVLASLALLGASWFWWPLPPSEHGPLRRAATWSFVAMLPYVAVCLAILSRRFTDGAHDPTAGAESASLSIHCRVMQNTLEQLVWFVLCVFPLATVLRPSEAHLLEVASVFFVVARLVYWWGYFRDGTLGRRFGVQMTFTLNISLFVLTSGLLLLR